MAETKHDFMNAEPAQNLGFVRFNWRAAAKPGSPLLVMVPYECDSAFDLVGALSALGSEVDVWRLDLRSTRAPRNRRAEIERMRRSWRHAANGDWVGVLPFEPKVAYVAARMFPDPVIILVTDDLAVIGVGDEGRSRNIRRSMLDAANSIAEMAVFATSTTLPLMMISMRKAKEFPNAVLQAIREFRGHTLDPSEIDKAAQLLGRPQVLVAVTPIRKLLAVDVVRGGIEPVHKNGAITGWAKRALSNDRIDIGARLNGQEIARTQADRQRHDLAMSGIGDGRHGFVLDVSRHLSRDPVRIEIYSIDSGYLIGTVDMNVERGERVQPETPPPASAAHIAAE